MTSAQIRFVARVAWGMGLWLLLHAPNATAACTSGEFAYRFSNLCSEEIFVGQRSKTGTDLLPEAGSFAAAQRCTENGQCASGKCDTDSGRCTCSAGNQCGNAACLADGKCSTWVDFCAPKNFNSGTFWPRTGCTLNNAVSPAQLSCATGACNILNTNTPLLDCTTAGSPTSPVTQFEATTTTTTTNYDVSIAAGFNVETYASPLGGANTTPGVPASQLAQCPAAGCTGDLNASCPTSLQFRAGGKVVGCSDPCTACDLDPGNVGLACNAAGPAFTDCSGNPQTTTNEDLYCAKNLLDGNAQSSANQGTPTAFSQLDCFPGLTFVQPNFPGGYTLPAGKGVCVYANAPQSGIQYFNDYAWDDAIAGVTSCGGATPKANGTPCGGYLTTQANGSTGYRTPPGSEALGYTCQQATFPVSGAPSPQTAYLCMPPTTSGLGVCRVDAPTSGSALPLYSGPAGVTNAAWLAAGLQAGGGAEPYYETFKESCPGAYTWQYDDASAGFGCDPTKQTSGGKPFQGYHVTFCGSRSPSSNDFPPPDEVVGLNAFGSLSKPMQKKWHRLGIGGDFAASYPYPLGSSSVRLLDILEDSGGRGELARNASGADVLPLVLRPILGANSDYAIFHSPPGMQPTVRLEMMRVGVPQGGQSSFRVSIAVTGAAFSSLSKCTEGKRKQPATELETGFLLESDNGASVLVSSRLDWNCRSNTLWTVNIPRPLPLSAKQIESWVRGSSRSPGAGKGPGKPAQQPQVASPPPPSPSQPPVWAQ